MYTQGQSERPTSAALPDKPALLRLSGVGFAYHPGADVLEALSGELHAGQLCIMIGPNAAGKSTLLRLMLGLLRPTAGRVLLAGRDVAELRPGHRAARVGYVPQGTRVPFAFTVRQVVEMGRHALVRDDRRVHWALRCCDLLDQQHRIFAELSAGQQQRVLLARALAQVGSPDADPTPDATDGEGTGRILLLDEPTSAMDLRHTHETMQVLRTQAMRGLAVLAVLHDLNLAARYADRIWLLHEGRLLEDAPWPQVLRPPVLEPVYGVKLTAHRSEAGDRPLFSAELTDTLRDEAGPP